MKRHKRDRVERAHAKGYIAGARGRSQRACPHQQADTRGGWLAGWRDGRECFQSGGITNF